VVGVALVCAAGVLCFRAGGYFHEPRATIAIGAWLAVALVAAALGPGAMWPSSRAGRLALGGLLGLATWTALSVAWAPFEEAARADAERVALYAAALPLAIAAFRARPVARAVEPALALLALVVICYGLLGELGLFEVTRSAGADGRLEQPLTYWNAMGAMAALGLVLCARLATDLSRAARLRWAAVAALAVLATGLVLTFSRGAVVAALVGLVVLALAVPEAARWRRSVPGVARVLAGAVAVALAFATVLHAASDRVGEPTRGATVERFAELGSDRLDYWEAAVAGFADAPVVGAGTASFPVVWLREREIPGAASDAHSLYLETAAELGLVGIALLGSFVGGTAFCLRRLVAGDAVLAVGPCAALAALAAHAGLDWDWELPALTLPALMLAGVALARSGAPALSSEAAAPQRSVPTGAGRGGRAG
jgi:O-antigen ligase